MRTTNQQFYYKNNRLQQMRGFCHTAQFGSITRAAKHMGLSQPNVSLQIQSLENDLGVALFKREGRTLTLTPEGEKFLAVALPHVSGIENIVDTYRKKTESEKDTQIRIAVNSTGLNFILPAIIKEFLEAYTDARMTLVYAEHDEALHLLETEEVDIALLPSRAHKAFPATVQYMPMFHYTPCLITLRDHPLAGRRRLSVQEISRYDLSLPMEDLRVIPNLYDIFEEHKIKKKLRIGFVNWETTRKYIEMGLVISISSDVILSPDDTLVGTPLNHIFADVNYGFVKKRGRILSDKAEQLLDIAKHYADKKHPPAAKKKRRIATL